jgi:predicted glycogen debranching enzyme
MDAACWMPDGRFAVFTPRPGKAVEVNALWVSNLRGVAEALSAHASRDPAMQRRMQRYLRAAHLAAASFPDAFWSEPLGHLRDHVRPDGSPDDTLRPNQLLACSLERSPLDAKRKQQVVEAVTRELLTPAGLRTLPARHHDYHAHYGGPQHKRDASYHQGTIWPWLLGPYCEGLLRAYAFSAEAKRRAASAIEPLLHSLTDSEDAYAAWGQLHEIHDAEPTQNTHLPRGCPAQAWSVAEVLRVYRLLA